MHTRTNPRIASPSRITLSSSSPQKHHKEADTVKRTRFFDAFDRKGDQAKEEFCGENKILRRTANRWLKERAILGSPAYRKNRKRSKRLGRKPKIPKEQLDVLVSPTQNPVRDQPYETQIAYHGIEASVKTLQRSLRAHKHDAQLFVQRQIQEIRPYNEEERMAYALEHKDKTVDNFWQFVHFSDEAHIDPDVICRHRILREKGTATAPENLQRVPDFGGCKIHIAASVSWHHKSPLVFYNDENDHIYVQAKKPRKPRKKKRQTEEQYREELTQWEARQPHDVDVKPKGNSMTQLYYTEKILPVYLREIDKQRALGRKAILQEDNDPSHGTRGNFENGPPNVPARFKQQHAIETMKHPAQSPDLNVKESSWNILLQRQRREEYHSIEQLKDVLHRVWKDIDQKEIQARIAEMPERCKKVIESKGKRIKTELW